VIFIIDAFLKLVDLFAVSLLFKQKINNFYYIQKSKMSEESYGYSLGSQQVKI